MRRFPSACPHRTDYAKKWRKSTNEKRDDRGTGVGEKLYGLLVAEADVCRGETEPFVPQMSVSFLQKIVQVSLKSDVFLSFPEMKGLKLKRAIGAHILESLPQIGRPANLEKAVLHIPD